MAIHSLDAPGLNDTDPAGHRPQCPFCFVAAKCASHPAMAGDVKDLPVFAVRDVAGVNDRAVHGRLHRKTGDPRGPPSSPV